MDFEDKAGLKSKFCYSLVAGLCIRYLALFKTQMLHRGGGGRGLGYKALPVELSYDSVRVSEPSTLNRCN